MTPQEEQAKIEVERKFYSWFFANVDLGPAEDDVISSMLDCFEDETGEILPSNITEGYR